MTMQSKNYQLYVFDWDGTVMDTTGLIARGMQQACVTLGYPQPDLDACRETIGLPFAESFARVAPGFRYEQLDEFLTAYRNWYLQREAQVDVMAGLEDLFDRMMKNGLRLAVATGKSRAGLIRVFERTGLEKSLKRRLPQTKVSRNPTRQCWKNYRTKRVWTCARW